MRPSMFGAIIYALADLSYLYLITEYLVSSCTIKNIGVKFSLKLFLFVVLVPVTISKAAILGIALGALVILLLILVAACRPQNPAPFPDGSLDKPGL